MQTYKPEYKPNQLKYGAGAIAVITGWTVKESVAKKLDAEKYAVVGQLYSPTRGINFLVRNLLLNPHVRCLLLLSATKEDENARGCECLNDFFVNGFTRGRDPNGTECWVIDSPTPGYIDIEIDEADLNLLRYKVSCTLHQSADSLLFNFDVISQHTYQSNPYADPKSYPIRVSNPVVLPGPRYGHRIEGRTIAETWVKIIHRIKTTGTIRPTGYDGSWQELIDLVAIVTDEPDNFYFPEPNYLPVDRDFIDSYLPQVLDDAPYQEGVKYTYGQRIRSHFERDQVEQVINKLVGEIDAASAVINLWDVKDHEKGGSPCLNHIWLRVVDNELSMTATFRSNDMFSAWPSNAMGLRALQKHIKDEIAKRSDYKLTLGPLITISQSAHIYDDCWENADLLIAKQYKQIVVANRDYSDPSGNFLISVEGKDIIVVQTTPGAGLEVKEFKGKSPLNLIREICSSSPALNPDHAGYLGIELQKAYQCIRANANYIQDK
jgi:thymidylate synthase